MMMQPNPKKLEALLNSPPTLQMRLARPTDAHYLYGLRINEQLNTHLSEAPRSEFAQTEYLERYVQREAVGLEYYFVIRNKKTGQDCGAVRIYDLQADSFCWGSWILDEHKTRTAAIESSIFVYEFGFGLLGFPSSHFDVRRKNEKVISFHERMGACRVREDELNVYFTLGRTSLEGRLGNLLKLASYRPTFLCGRD